MKPAGEVAASGTSAFGRRSLLRLAALTVGLAGAAYLLTRHAGHPLIYLPFLVLLACPLLHVFMHRGGHGSHN